MTRTGVMFLGRRISGIALEVAMAALFAAAAISVNPARAQNAPTAEEARQIEFGKEIFKSKAVCQYCHKWDASGDQGYGGNALSLRRRTSHPNSSLRS